MKEFFQALQGYGDVAAPVRATEKTHRFQIVRALEEADLSYTRTMIPPKKYFIHPEETIFTFDKEREEYAEPPNSPSLRPMHLVLGAPDPGKIASFSPVKVIWLSSSQGVKAIERRGQADGGQDQGRGHQPHL